MIDSQIQSEAGTLLLIGASRGLGLAMASQFVRKGWRVVGTVRGDKRTPFHDLAEKNPGKIEILQLDITDQSQIAAVRQKLADHKFEILFVNSGTSTENQHLLISEVSTEEFAHVLITNSLSPMRVIDELDDLVVNDGLIGVMSSGQGSITNNVKGDREVYRGSKAALNMYMRSYAARQKDNQRALILMAPGWIRTELGGTEAPATVEEAVPSIVRVLLDERGKPGLRFLDRDHNSVPW